MYIYIWMCAFGLAGKLADSTLRQVVKEIRRYTDKTEGKLENEETII